MTGEAAAAGSAGPSHPLAKVGPRPRNGPAGGPAKGIPAKGAELRIAQAATRSVRRLFRNR